LAQRSLAKSDGVTFQRDPKYPNLQMWPKGVSGNPSGRAKREITLDKVRDIIDRLAMMTREQIKALMDDAKTPLIELQFASILLRGIASGDIEGIDFLLQRMIGKVPTVSLEAQAELGELKNLTTQQLLEIVVEKYPELKKAGGD